MSQERIDSYIESALQLNPDLDHNVYDQRRELTPLSDATEPLTADAGFAVRVCGGVNHEVADGF